MERINNILENLVMIPMFDKNSEETLLKELDFNLNYHKDNLNHHDIRASLSASKKFPDSQAMGTK